MYFPYLPSFNIISILLYEPITLGYSLLSFFFISSIVLSNIFLLSISSSPLNRYFILNLCLSYTIYLPNFPLCNTILTSKYEPNISELFIFISTELTFPKHSLIYS